MAIIRFKNTMCIICCLTAGSLQLERGAVVVSEAFNTSAATYPITAPWFWHCHGPPVPNFHSHKSLLFVLHAIISFIFPEPLVFQEITSPHNHICRQWELLTWWGRGRRGKKTTTLSQKNKEVGGAPLQTTCTFVRTHSHSYPSILLCVPTKEGRPG